MPNDKPDLDALCGNCGKEYGEHLAKTLRCPKSPHRAVKLDDDGAYQVDKFFKEKVII